MIIPFLYNTNTPILKHIVKKSVKQVAIQIYTMLSHPAAAPISRKHICMIAPMIFDIFTYLESPTGDSIGNPNSIDGNAVHRSGVSSLKYMADPAYFAPSTIIHIGSAMINSNMQPAVISGIKISSAFFIAL